MELLVSKSCNFLLENWIISLEGNALNNVQYTQYIIREMLKVKPVPLSVVNAWLEQSIFCALLLICITIKPEDIHTCHQIKDTEKVTVKQANDVVFKRKVLKSKAERTVSIIIWKVPVHKWLHACVLRFLFYKCYKLKNFGRLSAVLFFNNIF